MRPVRTFAVELDGFALAITHWSDRPDRRSRRTFELALPVIEASSEVDVARRSSGSEGKGEEKELK